VNWYEHHLGDWAKKCSHHTFAEEGCYRRLLDWYYSNERPLPSDVKQVRKIARCKTTGDRETVQRVLAEFFEPMADGWHQSRVDRELESYAKRLPVTLQAKDSLRDRQHRAREKRSALFRLLDENGIHAPWNATNNTLFELCHEHGLRPPVTAPTTAPVTATVTVSEFPSTTTHISDAVAGTGLAVAGEGAGSNELEQVERRVAAARAVKKAGLTSVNPLDPRFMALIAQGATVSEMAVTATEAALKGKGWAWFLATVKGRRADAVARAQEAPKTFRQRADEARLREWAPELLSKP
jgi:uncharacterized protein YdaU (DUF1376 family)